MPTTLHVGSLTPLRGEVRNGRQLFRVDRPFMLTSDAPHFHLRMSAPVKLTTDLNSVPRFFNRFQPAQNYSSAAVLHDEMCVSKAVPSYVAAALYYWVLRIEGCSRWDAFCRWVAVSVFGPRFDGQPVGHQDSEGGCPHET